MSIMDQQLQKLNVDGQEKEVEDVAKSRRNKKNLKGSPAGQSTPLKNPEVKNQLQRNAEGDSAANDSEEEDEDDESSSEESSESSESDEEEVEETSANGKKGDGKKKKVTSHGLERKRKGPTKAQLAARSGISKHLPPFSGKSEDWPLFYAAYRSSTKACGYSKVDNLARLQQCLKGNALELVRGRLLLPKSVPRVISKLRQHFGRPEQLLQKFLDRIQQLEKPKNLRGFIPFSNVVEQLCEHLEAAKMKQHLNNPLLIKDLVQKLPDQEKREWAEVVRKQGKKSITLRTITDFLTRIADDACETGADIEFRAESEASSSQPSKEKGKHSGRMYLHSEVESENEDNDEVTARRLKPCKACQNTGHGLRFCEVFKEMPFVDRAELVSREKLCSICLNGHRGQCWFKIQCDVGECRERHNPLMHPVDADAIGLSAHIRTDEEVMFRIVPVQLHGRGQTVTVLAFLDEGASVTLMENQLANRLGLEGVREKLTIKWTGSVTRVEGNSRRMNVMASAVGDRGKVSLNKVRTVGQLLLPRQKLQSEELAAQYEHVRGLPIESYDGRPQILIGLNNLDAFAPIESKRSLRAGEPIAVRCNLGWTVYGPMRNDVGSTSNYLGFHCEVFEQQQPSNLCLPKQFGDEEGDSVTTEQVSAKASTPADSLVAEPTAVVTQVIAKLVAEDEKSKCVSTVEAQSTHRRTRYLLEWKQNQRSMRFVRKRTLRGVERADGAASAGSVSGGRVRAMLSVDEKVQLQDSEAKLAGVSRRVSGVGAGSSSSMVDPVSEIISKSRTGVHRRQRNAVLSDGKKCRGKEFDGKSGSSEPRPDVTGWSMLPRTVTKTRAVDPPASLTFPLHRASAGPRSTATTKNQNKQIQVAT